jgi:thermitase
VGYKVKGIRTADLSWSGATTGVQIYRDGQPIATGGSAGSYTDSIGGKGTGSFTYRVCETGGSACSNDVTVVF